MEAVGVFVNWPPVVVDALARALRLAAVQLHGAESPEEVAELARTRRVIKAVQVKSRIPCRIACADTAPRTAFLLDGFARGLHGGTGRTVDWKLARAARRYGRIILAGGLTPENVAEAIRVAAAVRGGRGQRRRSAAGPQGSREVARAVRGRGIGDEQSGHGKN